jgi:hypothetical protein
VTRFIQFVGSDERSEEIWIGWELEADISGEIPGLIRADRLTEAAIQARGVMEFQRVTTLGERTIGR